MDAPVSAKDWRPLIETVVREMFPQLEHGPDWIEAQIHVESRGISNARSPVGAVGLLQLMPRTADELGVRNTLDPEENLRGGVRYLRQQYEHLAEIQTAEDRLAWAFASYNGGRGYVNRALHLAYGDEEPEWWTWGVGRFYLAHRDCMVSGRYPDYRQIRNYVAQIRAAKAAL